MAQSSTVSISKPGLGHLQFMNVEVMPVAKGNKDEKGGDRAYPAIGRVISTELNPEGLRLSLPGAEIIIIVL